MHPNGLGLYHVYVNNPGGAVSNSVRLQGLPVITWTNPSPIIYGAPLTTNQLNSTANVVGSFAFNPPAGTILDTGTNTLSVIFTPTDTVNYSNATNTVRLVVSPAPLAIIATNRGKMYGQTILFSGTEFSTSGLVNGDTVTSASIASAGAVPTAPVGGSPYIISITNALGDSGLTNYIITYTSGSLTVGAAPLSVTAGAESKTYGQTLVFGGGSALFTSTKLQNGETIGSVTLAVSGNGGAATASVAGSPYTITPQRGDRRDLYAGQLRDYLLHERPDCRRGGPDSDRERAEQDLRPDAALRQRQHFVLPRRFAKRRHDWNSDIGRQRQWRVGNSARVRFTLHNYAQRGDRRDLHAGQLRDQLYH